MKKLLMGSLVLTTFALASVIFQMSSCKKAHAEGCTTFPVQGLWVGTFSVDHYPEYGNSFYSFVIYPDGKIVTKGIGSDGKDYYSSGTWTLSSNNVFSATIVSFETPLLSHAVTQTITANFSTSGKMTDGIWIDTINPNGTPNTGKYSTMQRVN